MKTLIEKYFTQVALVILIGVVAYDKLHKESTPTNPSVIRDANVVALGKQYAVAFGKDVSLPLDAVANGSFANLDDLTKAQQESLDTVVTNAWRPVAAELEKRFGKAEDPKNNASIAQIKQFYSDLSFGVKGK